MINVLCIKKDSQEENITIGKVYELLGKNTSSYSRSIEYFKVKGDDGLTTDKYATKFFELDPTDKYAGKKVKANIYPYKEGIIVKSENRSGSIRLSIFFPEFKDGHHLDILSKDIENGWFIELTDVTFIKDQYEKGDRVIAIKSYNGRVPVGSKGTFIVNTGGNPCMGIEWDNFNNGHNLNGHLPGSRSGYFVHPEDIELLEKETQNNLIEKTIIYNGEEMTVFGETNHESFDKYLRSIYKDQGEFYEKVFGIDRQTADTNYWHPEDTDFNNWCDGWKYFIKDKGIPKKVETPKLERQDIKQYIINNIF